jgi:hypothetical protein
MSDDPPGGPPIGFILERQIRHFERETGWRVSSGAQLILQTLLAALLTDQIGLIGTEDRRGLFAPNDPGRRRDVLAMATRAVPDFLLELRHKAEPVARFADARAFGEADVREIGAIFLVQNLPNFELLAKCSSWPTT